MKKFLPWFAILFFIHLVHASERPWKKYLHDKALEVNIPRLESFKLSNGITVHHVINRTIPKFQFKLVIEGGEFEEPDGKLGLTGLWGDTVTFSGSNQSPREKLSRLLELNAAHFSFHSSLERSSFTFSSLKSFSLKGLETILEVVNNPRFSDEEYLILQKQKLQSIKKRKEDPATLGYLASSINLWKGTTRARLETTSTVNSITTADLQNWQKRMLCSNRISIVLAGDFDMAAVKEILEKQLGPIRQGDTVLTTPLQSESQVNIARKNLYHVEKEIPQTTIILKSNGIAHHSKDYFALKVFDLILGGDAFNSHLMQQIRVKRGWAYSVYSHYSSGKYGGEITIFAQSQNKNTPDVLQVFEEILRHPEEYVTENRIEKARQSLTNKYVFLYETPMQLADARELS